MGQKNKNIKTKIFIIVVVSVIVLAAACGIYLGDFYHAEEAAIEAFAVENAVSIREDAQGNLVVEPDNAGAGLIFYPGGKVEYSAYIPLMKALASEGVLCVLVEMPFHLAVFDVKAADGIREQYPEIEKWYIGGHSLGGSMAAAYLEENVKAFDGLILLGSYSTADFTAADLDVISIYGSEDRVINIEKYETYKENLPSDFKEVIIDGGCHAYFGMYGDQEGDGEPNITNEEQIDQTVDAIMKMIFGDCYEDLCK